MDFDINNVLNDFARGRRVNAKDISSFKRY